MTVEKLNTLPTADNSTESRRSILRGVDVENIETALYHIGNDPDLKKLRDYLDDPHKFDSPDSKDPSSPSGDMFELREKLALFNRSNTNEAELAEAKKEMKEILLRINY